MINKIGKRKQQGRFICAAPLKQCSLKSSAYDNKNVVTLYFNLRQEVFLLLVMKQSQFNADGSKLPK